jgi:signal transduction histidine kinase
MAEIAERMSAHGRAGNFVSRSYDIVQQGQKIGKLALKYYAPFSLSESDFSFLSALNGILGAIGALSLLLSFVTGFFLARGMARPIRKTAAVAGQIAAGRYDVRFESRTKTKELHEMVLSINSMAEVLARQELLRQQLTADIAHELRTPLTTLGSHLEAMIEGLWEATPERLKSCHDEILRLGNIVNDLEQLEQADSDNLKLNKTFFELKQLSKTVCDNFAASLAAKNLRLEIKGSAGSVFADKDKINGVIANLVSNAVKYTPNEGIINVIIQDAASAVSLIIEDNGPGIPAEELPLIFERLYRADKSRNRATGGAGLGLAIVKSVVKAHGGSVKAENPLDGGCRFTVTLPR